MAVAKKRSSSAVKGKPTLRLVNHAQVAEDHPLTSTERAYFRALNKAIDEIYEHATEVLDWTWSKLAGQAELSYDTVHNLGQRWTRWPRFFTIWKLARAVGWHLHLKGKGTKRTVVLKKAG